MNSTAQDIIWDVDKYIELKLVHEIHTSERRSFRACRRRWDWLFRENRYPKVTAKPLEFGVAFHAAMEVYYAPETWDWDREVVSSQAIMKFVEECEKQKAIAIEENGHLYLDGEQEEDYAERVELGRGMLTYYFTHVAPFEDQNWTPSKVEIKFMVAIPHPETGETLWCKCDSCWNRYVAYARKVYEETGRDDHAPRHLWNGLPVVYAGRLDMLAVDGDGGYWIFDWKTTRSIAENYEFLYLDDQIGSYVWALDQIGIPVRGFVYHEQRKGYPQPPAKNKVRRLGCIFSKNKNQDTNYEMYLKTIMAEDREAYEEGLYDDMLDFLKAEGITYFARHQIHKSPTELVNIGRNIGMEALDMINPDLLVYPSPGRFGCNFCAFREPCISKNDGSDYQYTLDTMFEIKEPYYVRQEKGPSTESKGGE